MHDAETRALRRAVGVLLVVSALRAAWEWRPSPATDQPASVLPELSEAVEAAADEAERRSRPLGAGERLDANRAAAEDLDRLPGVGPALAEAIVQAREEGAVFRGPADLQSVRGIGPSLAGRIAGSLSFASPPSGRRPVRPGREALVDVNRAGEDVLVTLPGVGPALAERIVARRRTRPFSTVEDLLEVRGIGPATLERLRSRVTVSGRPP